MRRSVFVPPQRLVPLLFNEQQLEFGLSHDNTPSNVSRLASMLADISEISSLGHHQWIPVALFPLFAFFSVALWTAVPLRTVVTGDDCACIEAKSWESCITDMSSPQCFIVNEDLDDLSTGRTKVCDHLAITCLPPPQHLNEVRCYGLGTFRGPSLGDFLRFLCLFGSTTRENSFQQP
ncbi:hypothetical protein BDZ89DRAFT_1043141 [Hymenopellis radicata]|nr:hypothetical protein BDZ89DRAFT_1043141 [Hymenopellis radicata]